MLALLMCPSGRISLSPICFLYAHPPRRADKEYTLQVKPSGVNRNFSIDEVLILNAQGSVVQRFSTQPLNGSSSGATSVRVHFTSLVSMFLQNILMQTPKDTSH